MFIIASRKQKFAYIPIEKVACTSIKFSLVEHMNIDRHAKECRIHNREKLFPTILQPELPDFYSFAFVRNPYARILSCWTEKVSRFNGKQKFSPLYADIRTNTSFPEFVRWATSFNPKKVDLHIRPQSQFIVRDGRIIVDFVGRIENMHVDWALLQKRFGFPDVKHSNKTNKKHYSEYYDEKTKVLIDRYYAEDIGVFGYEY